MSTLLRFLGLSDDAEASGTSEDETIRQIAEQLESLEPDRASFMATFAYVLARVAGADLHIDDTELAEMRRVLVSVAGIGEEEAALVSSIATSQMEQVGATQNFLVTRRFREISSRAQRVRLLHCLFAVAAADDTITGDESNEVLNIADELGLSREEALGIRSGFRDKLAALRKLPGET